MSAFCVSKYYCKLIVPLSFDQNLLLVFLVISCVAGILMRRKLEGIILRSFPYFLAFSCAAQIFAKEYSRPLPHKSNHWIYNIYSPIECVFYSLLLIEAIRNKQLRMVSIAFIIVYCFFAAYNILFLQGFQIFNSYTYIVEAITIVFLSLCVFIEIARLESDESLFVNPIFWIASALVITFLGDFIIMGLLNLMVSTNHKYTLMTFSIIKYLSILRSIFFTIAFICKSPAFNTKPSL